MKIIKNKKGFTLVEVLVVVAIIGILAVTSTPILLQNIDSAKVARIITKYDAFKKATINNIGLKEGISTDDLDDLKAAIKKDVNSIPEQTPIGGQYELDRVEGGQHPNQEGDRLEPEPTDTKVSWDIALVIEETDNSEIFISDKSFKQLVKTIGNTNIIIKDNKIYLKIVD